MSPPISFAAVTVLAVASFSCGVVVLGEDQDGHQSTPASVLSLAISSSTEPTLTPALRVAGSTVFSTFSRGATSTP